MSRYSRKQSFWLLPENLFILFAIPFGIIFTMLLPPLAGSDEYFHYQRIATVAYGHFFNEDAAVPSGIALFLKKTTDYLMADELLPYTLTRYFDVASIPLGADTTGELKANYCTIHNAANYIPQVVAFRMAASFGASPLMLLYTARLTALLASVCLTYHAIRVIPSWKYALCALALLPPLSLYRVCLSSDAITDALGIYFLSCVLREISRTDPIKRASLLRLTVLGFLIGLCKLPYVCITLMVCAISVRRFPTPNSRFFWCALVMIPGTIAGLWWMEMSRRSGVFTGLHYETWGGQAFPDGQMEYITHNPLGFAGVLANTVFTFSFYTDALKEAFGHYGTMAQSAFVYYFIMVSLLVITLWMDGTSVKASYTLHAKLLTLPAFGAFMLLALTALYVHWTGLQAPAVKGFQGRYLYPLLPMFLMVLPYRGRPHAAITSALAAGMFAIVGLSLTVPVLLQHWK